MSVVDITARIKNSRMRMKLSRFLGSKLTQDNEPKKFNIREFISHIRDTFIIGSIDHVIDFIIYCKQRFIIKPNLLRTGLPNDSFHEYDTKLLYAAFTGLIDHVEIELSSTHIRNLSRHLSKEQCREIGIRWWHNNRYIHDLFFLNSRNEKTGLYYFDDLMKLDDPAVNPLSANTCSAMANNAREILELYTWWKYIRVKRIDSYIASGLMDICDKNEKLAGKDWQYKSCIDDKINYAEYDAASVRDNKIQEKYSKEDDEMFMRLIKVRHLIWS